MPCSQENNGDDISPRAKQLHDMHTHLVDMHDAHTTATTRMDGMDTAICALSSKFDDLLATLTKNGAAPPPGQQPQPLAPSLPAAMRPGQLQHKARRAPLAATKSVHLHTDVAAFSAAQGGTLSAIHEERVDEAYAGDSEDFSVVNYYNDRVHRQFRNNRRGMPPPREVRPPEDIPKVKFTMPSFEGRYKPDIYLDWELKVEQRFACHDFPEDRRVKAIVCEFTGFASFGGKNIVELIITIYLLQGML